MVFRSPQSFQVDHHGRWITWMTVKSCGISLVLRLPLWSGCSDRVSELVIRCAWTADRIEQAAQVIACRGLRL